MCRARYTHSAGTGRGPGAFPPREPAPYQDRAKAKAQESFDRRGIDDPIARCLMAGIPRSTTVGLFPMRIVQTPNQVIMLYELLHAFRVIPLNAKHPDDLEPTRMGDSMGRWDGDTLVVDVIGFNGRTWIGATGTFHSAENNTDIQHYEQLLKDESVFRRK